MQVLLIEMDPASSGWLGERLPQAGFATRLANSPGQALLDDFAQGVAAIIVDIGQGEPKAFAVTEFLRKAGLCQPLVILAAHGDWRDKVDCLDAGADEYLLKPVRTEEIAARLRTIIRRCAGNPTDRIMVGDIELDLKAKCAWRAGECLDLTRNEFRLLCLFLLRPDHVMSHEEIRAQLYTGKGKCSLNAIEVQISRLRRKVGQDRIRSVRGIGYRYVIGDITSHLDAWPQRGPCKAMCTQDRCVDVTPAPDHVAASV